MCRRLVGMTGALDNYMCSASIFALSKSARFWDGQDPPLHFAMQRSTPILTRELVLLSVLHVSGADHWGLGVGDLPGDRFLLVRFLHIASSSLYYQFWQQGRDYALFFDFSFPRPLQTVTAVLK